MDRVMETVMAQDETVERKGNGNEINSPFDLKTNGSIAKRKRRRRNGAKSKLSEMHSREVCILE